MCAAQPKFGVKFYFKLSKTGNLKPVFEKRGKSRARFYFKLRDKKGFPKNNILRKLIFLPSHPFFREVEIYSDPVKNSRNKFRPPIKNMEISSDLRQLLTQPKNVAILSHRNPDGDAIGSSLAMRHYLENYGHTVHVIVPSEFPAELDFLPGSQDVMIWDIHTDECKTVLTAKDVFIYLDFNSLSRIDKVGDFIKSLPRKKSVMIDHHLFPDDMADWMFSEPTASSTCELVYDFINAMGDNQKISPKVGDCIYTGLVTDTGSFRHATNAHVFRIVADLLEHGVNDTGIQDALFNCLKEKNLRLLGHCLYNRMEIFPEFRTGLIYLTKKDYEDFDISRGDTEGIVNYLLSIKSVKLAAFIHNQPTIVKISLRSKGDLDVQEICRKHFNGGGHKNASGAHSHDSLKAVVTKFKDLLPLYKTELLK